MPDEELISQWQACRCTLARRSVSITTLPLLSPAPVSMMILSGSILWDFGRNCEEKGLGEAPESKVMPEV
jgi:hypothetical protein